MTWNELSQASLEEIMAWASDQSWCRAMADCEQDGGWHSEGNVWTHTQMVCAELPRLDEWPSLTPRQRMLLAFTALFHDAAKPLTVSRWEGMKPSPSGETFRYTIADGKLSNFCTYTF